MDNSATGHPDRYVLFVTWKAIPGGAAAVTDILQELRRTSLSEPGCLAFEVYRDSRDDQVFFLYEVYRGLHDHTAHMSTEHFKRLVLERALPLLEQRERRFCRPLEESVIDNPADI